MIVLTIQHDDVFEIAASLFEFVENILNFLVCHGDKSLCVHKENWLCDVFEISFFNFDLVWEPPWIHGKNSFYSWIAVSNS